MSHLPSHKHTQHRARSSNRGELGDFELRELAASIIRQAVDDWIRLLHLEDMERKGCTPKQICNFRVQHLQQTSYLEIRQFFHSGYGTLLCETVSLDPEDVLDRLEFWLKDYRANGTLPRYLRDGGRQERRV